MLSLRRFTVAGVIQTKTKLKRRDQVLDSQRVGDVRQQQRKKDRPLSVLETASVFVKQLRSLLSEIFKCVKTLSQLLIAVLLMLEFCKEQQHSDGAIIRDSATESFDRAVIIDICGVTPIA
jgi:hypothetical protein